MSRFYKIDETEKAIHIIIGKKGDGQKYREEIDRDREYTRNKLIEDILNDLRTYQICIDDRVTGIEVFNAIINMINNYRFK